MKKILLMAILLISMMFIVTTTSYAWNPPIDPAIETLMGPAIVGTFTASPSNGGTNYMFEGNCKGESVEFGGSANTTYTDITKESLENLRLGVPGDWGTVYPSCLPNKYTDYFIVNTVIRFNKTESLATADVVIMFRIPKK